MLIVVTYDVSTVHDEGRKRLRKVSKTCLKYGMRVQNSVFECHVQANEYVEMKAGLLKCIDENEDSLRLYDLGNKYDRKVEHYGVKHIPDLENDVLII